MPLSISTDRFRAVAAVSVMLCAALWVTGCANPGSSTPRTSVTTVTVTPSGASVPATGSPPANPDASPAVANGVSPSLAKALTAVLSQQPGSVGVAIGPVGGDLPAQAFGDLDTDVAWSTIKVPLALAAQRAGGRMALSAITEAIVNSDNAAAEQLWSMLGTPAQAAAAVQRVLAESGDTKTVVESQRVRSGFTAFGQTEWSLVDTADFASQLPCQSDSKNVLTLMREVAGNQQWGMHMVEGAAVKGGWGPGVGSGYLVRQLAIVPTANGDVAIAMATTADSGTFEAGTAILDTVSAWLSTRLDQLPAGVCDQAVQ